MACSKVIPIRPRQSKHTPQPRKQNWEEVFHRHVRPVSLWTPLPLHNDPTQDVERFDKACKAAWAEIAELSKRGLLE